MIPLRLELKNFLSYGPNPQSIDFEPYHLLCLSGKNGHGKSAILDAITWSIWGQARKLSGTSKADDGLLHLGQSHMMVIIEFCVGANTYRIRREYVKTKSKPFSSLDFGILNTDGSIKALTDKTIKATQQKIEEAIGITYDAFINSTFLRQGNSGEFSKKSAKERKQLLASILQLQELDTLKQQAQEQYRILQNEITAKESIANHITNEHEQLLPHKDEHKKVTQEIDHLEKKQKELAQLYRKNKKAVEAYQSYLAQLQHAQQELQKREHEAQQTHAVYKETKATFERIHTADNKNELEKLSHDIQAYKKQQLNFEKKQKQHHQLREQYIEYKEKLHAQETSFEKELQQQYSDITHQIQEQTKKLHNLQKQEASFDQQKIYLTKEYKQLASEQKNLEETIQKNNNLHYQQAKDTYETTLSALEDNQYKQGCFDELQKIQNHKIEVLSSTQPCCTTCEQQVSGSRKQHLIRQIKHKQETQKSTSTTLQQHYKQYKKELESAHTLYIQLHASEQTHRDTEKKLQELTHKITNNTKQHADIIAQLNRIKKESVDIQKKLQPLEALIQNWEEYKQKEYTKNTQLQQLQKKLETIIQVGKAISYDAQQHQTCSNQLVNLEKQYEYAQNSQTAQAKQSAHQELLELFSAQAKAELNVQEHKKHIKKLEKQCNTYKQYQELDSDLQKQQEDVQKELTILAQKQGALQAHLTKLETLTKQQKHISKEIEKIKQEAWDFQQLSKALSKDGLQALLIEQAIPEIEQEANTLLGQLTNNQTQIFIESLRDLKKGGHKETLDIKIADACGIRPYEMFSGGEAFRIDFALRIAISKLLARRAGTNLQTLIIDEGFGSQDEEGLGLIMDCIHTIQNQFAKIIVISHLQDLQDQFPVHFKIQKQATGSMVSVLQQA